MRVAVPPRVKPILRLELGLSQRQPVVRPDIHTEIARMVFEKRLVCRHWWAQVPWPRPYGLWRLKRMWSIKVPSTRQN